MSTSHSKHEAPGVFDVKKSKGHKRALKTFFKRWFYDRNVLNLKPKFRIRHPFAWTLICLVLVLVVFWGVHQFSIHAEVSDFYPTTCLGDWQNPANAEGRPETAADPQVSFSSENSALFNGSDSQIFCGGFLPSGVATSGNITNVGLTLVWQVGDQSSTQVSGDTSSDTGSGATSTASSSDGSDQGDNTTIATTTTDTTTTPSSSDQTTITPPDQSSSSDSGSSSDSSSSDSSSGGSNVTTPSDQSSSDITSPSTPAPAPSDPSNNPPADPSTPPPADSPSSFLGSKLFSLFINKVFADDSSTTDGTTDSDNSTTVITAPTDDTSTDASVTPPVVLGPPLVATLAPSSTPTSSDDVSSTDTDLAPTTTPPVVTAPELPDQNFLQISYSLDGQLWIQLQKVSINNWNNLTFTLPVNSWSDLANLQIKIEGIQTTQDPIPPVYLDGMFVEVHYTSEVQPVQPPAGPILTDKSAYLPGDYIHVVGADPASFVVIYDTTDPVAGPQYDYATQIKPDGTVDIDTGTLHPGAFTLVETMDPQSCNVDSLVQCEASNYFVSEAYVTIESPPGQ